MNPLDELFMAQTMTSLVTEMADQSEENSFTQVYEDGDRILPLADDFVYDEVTFSRGMAPVTGTGSPSKPRQPLDVKKRAGRIFAVKAHTDLPAPLLMMARGAGQTMPDPEGWLTSNLQNLMNECQRTRNFWAAGSLLGSSVDLGALPNTDLPVGTTLTYPVATLSSVSGAWSAPATKIRSGEIPLIKKAYRRNTGFNAGLALASDTVEGYITDNTQISNAVDGGGVPTLAQRKIEASYIDGGSILRFGGMDWKFARDYYVTDANQAAADAADSAPTTTDVVTDPDLVAILCPPSRHKECFAMAEGRVFIPNGLITSMAVGNPASLISEVRGWAAWLELILNPVGLRLHVAWHGNFIQKRRRAVLVYNPTP